MGKDGSVDTGVANPVLNTLVHQYLVGVDPKLAKKFENNVGMELPELPKEMPPLTEMVASYQKKRKADMKGDTNGAPKAKKSKGDSESSEEDDSSDEEEKMEVEKPAP